MNFQDAYDKRKEMWASMDVNGNGYLSLAEVTKVRKQAMSTLKLDLAFNNVKPKDWYFVLD